MSAAKKAALFLVVALLGAAGCSTLPKAESTAATGLSSPTSTAQPVDEPAHLRPRPQIVKAPGNRPAISNDGGPGTPNVTPEVDPQWKSFGAYLQRLIDRIQIEWENNLISRRSVLPPAGTKVTVTFVIGSDGRLVRIANVENHSNEVGAKACVDAIKSRAPYGQWTDEMIAALGREQQMTFTFYYQ